ncbi:MAG: S8 family serine peptidase, partial [Bacteroidota bacterium]
FSSSTWVQKVDHHLLSAFNQEPKQDFIVLMQEQADVSFAYQLLSKQDKGRFVFERLSHTASRSQADIQALLLKEGAPFHSIHIYNAIYTKGDIDLLEKIAKRKDVTYIYANSDFSLQLPKKEESALSLRSNIEWNIANTGAPDIWAMGYTGQGAVIGGQDTGYEWDHPAITRQYRGNHADTIIHDYSWHDAIRAFSPLNPDTINPCGLDLSIPCDDNSHGTHTMGIMVGDDGMGNQIGVAPGAKWIGVRNMERGKGNPMSYTESFQWFLAPTDINGQNPDPTMAPDAITNSWYCPELEGCNAENRPLMELAVNNLRAAGVMVVVSAGNAGNNCATINEIPSAFPSTFAIGATDINNNIASFSSRGPVYLVDSSILVKPDISAPGVNVRSAFRGGNYARFSGTSMSGPHVTGTIALMISANPNLAGQVDSIEQILRRTARPTFAQQDCDSLLGDQIPNAVFGYGILDAKAAVEAALQFQITSTKQEVQQAALQLFPNPSSDRIWIKLEEPIRQGQIQIYDIQGRLMLQERLEEGISITSLDITPLQQGQYFYQLNSNGKIWSGKFQKVD